MNRSSPFPWCRTAAAWLLVISSLALASPAAGAQPNPGIDPCSRTLALLASPTVAATPDPASSRLDVSQAVMNFASCFDRHNWDGVLALTEEPFRQSLLGAATEAETRERLDLLVSHGLLPDIRIHAIEESGTIGTNMAALTVTWQGWNGLHQELWRLRNVDGRWKLNDRTIDRPLVSGVAVGIQVTIRDNGLVTPRTELMNPGTVILAFDNQRASAVTVLVLFVLPDASTDSIAQACNSSSAPLEPAGSIAVEPGKTAYLPLMDLPPGRYALLTGADPCLGVPDVTSNQIALLDVTT